MTEHVPIHPDLDCTWGFVLPSNAETCDGQLREIAELCRRLYASFADFLVPLEAAFTVQSFPKGTAIPERLEDTEARLDAFEVELSEPTGVEIDTLLEAMQPSDVQAGFVGRIDFDNVSVNVRLSTGDAFANRDAATVEYHNGEPADTDPYQSPIELHLFYNPNYAGEALDSSRTYHLQVKSHTDLWFGTSDLARENANRFSNFLGRIDDELPVLTVDRRTNREVSISMTDVY